MKSKTIFFKKWSSRECLDTYLAKNMMVLQIYEVAV